MTQPAVPESNVDLSDLTGAAQDVKPPTGSNNTGGTPQSGNPTGVKNSTGQKKSTQGDGLPQVGDVVTYTGEYYWASNGVRPTGNYFSGEKDAVQIIAVAQESEWWHPTHPYALGKAGTKPGEPYHDLGWVQLKQLSGYKSGTPSVDKDKFALMNEGGGMETVVRPDGTILTPLSKRTMVLNAESTSNMWRMLQDPEKFMGTVMKNADIEMTNNNGGSVENNIEVNIQVAHVDDFDDFMRQLQHSEKFEQLFSSMFDNRSKGTSKFNKFNVRI